MDTKLLHIRDKLEFIIRFMMAGDGSFKARLSEAYRHPQYGLRQIPVLFLPKDLQDAFDKILTDIDNNEHSRVRNDKKMELMDEVFLFYKKVCDLIFAKTLDEAMNKVFAPPVIEQSDVPTTGIISELFPTKMPRPKKIKKPKKEKE